MKNRNFRIANILLVLMVFLASCNLPRSQTGEELALTAAAQTVEALTSAIPPTSTFTPIPLITSTSFPTVPVVTNTPAATPTSNCNVAQFITDVTIPDGTIMTPGQAFTKKWRVRNIGSCAWNGYTLNFDSGDAMGAPASKAIGVLNPGQEVDIDVNMTAPAAVGTYRGYWRIVTNGGVLVPVVNGYQGKSFYVDIKVQSPATATNTSAPLFAVTSVNFTNVGGCNGFTATANITVNGPGTVDLHWIRSDGATPPVPPSLVFAAAGTQSVNISWNTSASGTHWFDIYIDSPNHQQFGRASFICP